MFFLLLLVFVSLKRFFGFPVSAQPTFSAIYNSLRYNVDAHTVTFHLCEKDWNELKSNSWMRISSSYLVPIINCEDVRLGDEIVESISQVDPVKKFGLFSAQTFTVAGFNESDQVIKVSLKSHLISIIVCLLSQVGQNISYNVTSSVIGQG